MIVRKLLTAAALVTTLAAIGTADAQTLSQRHPRRAEVNARLAHQNARIYQGLRDHQLTRAEAHQLRSDDRSIRAEERADAGITAAIFPAPSSGRSTLRKTRTVAQFITTASFN